MYRLFIVISSLLFCKASFALVDYRAISPAALAEIEAKQIESLKVQNGCARPDLSDSNIDGTAVVAIRFDKEGSPIDGKIVSSNGSDSENKRIVEAFTRKCKYSRKQLSIPGGVVKEFTYSWKVRQNLAGISGCLLPYVDYPPASHRLGEQGIVEISFRYLPGNNFETKISQSSGFPRLDDAALKLIKLCLENDALKGESDAEKWLSVRFNWKLDEGDQYRSKSSQKSQVTEGEGGLQK